MGAWTLDDILWHRFAPGLVDPDLLCLAKAASLVEANGAAYADHLCLIFADDPEFQKTTRRWGAEETQHGEALARWAALADPDFDFSAAFARFRAGFRGGFERPASRRGSRSGEMIARCMVETGTSTYYAALGAAAQEPVLKEICRRIAADEVRHFTLFRRTLEHCLRREPLGLPRRLIIALGRVAETRDDELAYAYFAANGTGERYDRRRHGRAYAHRASTLYRAPDVMRGVAMVLRTVGLRHNGALARAAGRLAWRALRWRIRRMAA